MLRKAVLVSGNICLCHPYHTSYTAFWFICPMKSLRGVLQILEILSHCVKESREMIFLCDFHTQVLGCSHKGERQMGCEDGFGYSVSERERERCLSTTRQLHTRLLQLCSVYHVWRKTVNK